MRYTFIFLSLCFWVSCSSHHKTAFSTKEFKVNKKQYVTCAFIPAEIEFSNSFMAPKKAILQKDSISNLLYESLFDQIDLEENPLTIKVQDKDTTLDILLKNNIAYDKIFEIEPRMLAKMLNVDVLAYSKLTLHSDFILAYKSTIITAIVGTPSTDLVDYSMVLVDGKTNKFLWKNQRQRTTFIGSKSLNAVDELKNIMPFVYKDFPYRSE
jgi:hypothetical protein